MGSELKNAVEDQISALEEDISPIPTIILDNVVSFSLHPEVKADENEAA